MINNKIKAWGIIFLLVAAAFAFSYNLEGALGLREFKEGKEMFSFYEFFRGLIFDEDSFVSASEDDLVFDDEKVNVEEIGLFDVLWSGGGDVQSIINSLINSAGGGVSICTINKQSSICQTYTNDVCEENCDGECVEVTSLSDGSFSDVPEECTIGLCYDEEYGTCEPNSPMERCESTGGISLPPDSNDARCRKGCCFLGDQGKFITNQNCRLQAESKGFEFGGETAYFDETIVDEFLCLVQANTNADAKGACTILRTDGMNDCSILNVGECIGLGGIFNEGLLCSHPSLNTTCVKTNKTACDEELNAVYWYDSCGNRENVFDGSESDEGWNNGEILARSDSCSVSDSSSVVGNQDDCGNCDYIRGSKCMEETDNEELDDDPDSGFVCRDLGCFYEGERRENGESWCAYQSQFGVEGLDIPGLGAINTLWGGNLGSFLGGQKSLDTPGSRHFRMNCFDGVVTPVACQNYRNQICVESQTEKEVGSGTFSQAVCRLNRWQECLNYNPRGDGSEGLLGKVKVQVAMTKCDFDPDCFVKYVNVDDDFQFPFCAPKYPPGFDLKNNVDGAKTLCGLATQTCNVIYIKELSGWECKNNCECEEDKFAKEMNNLCVSIGDCGMSVNYIGDNGIGGYVVKEGKWKPTFGAGDLIGNLLGGLFSGDAGDAVEGEYISAEESSTNLSESIGKSAEDLFSGIGVDVGGDGGAYAGGPRVRPPGEPANPAGGAAMVGGITGGIGAGVVAVGYGLESIATTSFAGIEAILGPAIPGSTAIGGVSVASISAFGGALAGAGIGMAVAGILLEITGVGRGLPAGASYAMIGAAGVGGGLSVGAGAVAAAAEGAQAGAFLTGATTGVGLVGLLIVIVVIVIIIIFKLFGIGDIDEREYTFECKPWQPPLGGSKCEECGNGEGLHDDLPCSRYSCESLGQSCEFIDQEPNALCVDASHDDTSGPRISEWEEIAFDGNEYEDVNANGYDVRFTEGQECMTQFQSVRFGINVDEYARCRYSNRQMAAFDEMLDFGGGTMNREHSLVLGERDLAELFEEGYEPDENNYVDIYVECQDVNGNPSPGDYVINLCVYPEDLTAPAIFIKDPVGGTLPFGIEEATVSVVTNEPAELRWSFDDVAFDDMSETFECAIDGADEVSLKELSGIFDCRNYDAVIPIDQDEVRICVKGRDHPEWEGTNQEEDRNTNEQCRWITLTRSEFALEIVLIEPNDTIIDTGLAISTIELVVETKGGDGGAVSCSYYVNGQGPGIFSAPDGNFHKQELNRITPGDYDIDVECTDSAGNSASGSSSFSVELDSESPEVTRFYNQGGRLYVVTNEQASCAFVTSEDEVQSRCGFDFIDGTLIPAVQEGGKTHSISFDESLTHYIRCKDIYGNEPRSCNAIVRGGLA